MKRILIGLFLVAAIAAAPAWAEARETLGVGDAVRVTVFQQPDLTTEARISERGTIAMPLLGEVKVAGLTPEAAGGQIASALKKGDYLKHPQVTVALTTVRSRQVSVLGLVARPGRYPLDDTSTRLADVIAAAGGIGAGGSDTVTVIRGGKTEHIDLRKASFSLQNGDEVFVESAPVFYVYGEVMRGGAYPVSSNLTVMQAISLGGGISPRGSDRRVKLRRVGPDGKVVETDADLKDIVKANDVIFVKESLF